MTLTQTLPSSRAADHPAIRSIGVGDIGAALRAGLDDFAAMPTHVLFAIMLYPLAGLVIATVTFEASLIPLLFPLLSGFALIGPFAGIGLYELSRRRERGLDTGWADAYAPLRSRHARAILSVGGVLAAVFAAWLVTAMVLFHAVWDGHGVESVPAFAEEVLTTRHGWTLIALGVLVGFAFALITLAVSVVSLPMLVDRDVDALTAIETSLAVTRANPGPILAWGFVVALLLTLGMLPLFVGLAVVLPVLGHASWHLYRRTVAD